MSFPLTTHNDFSGVIAFQAGTEWSPQLHLDLNKFLIVHPSATFFLRVKGNSRNHHAIRHGDILIVDRALPPRSDSTIVAVVDGALVIVPYRYLAGREPRRKPDMSTDGSLSSAESAVWGVVTYVIHKI